VGLQPSHSGRRNDLGGVFLGALAITLGGAALGLMVNHWSPRGIPVMQKVEVGRLPLPPGMTGISLPEVKAAFDAKDTPILDARGSADYAEGHIPGAHDLPIEQFETRYLDLAEQLEKAPRLIVYCESADCGEAIELAERLKEAYPGAILVFLEGWNGWTAAGYPVTKGQAP